MALSQKEDPFDVFICYKESNNQGKRTPDSVLAQELYYELTELGYKVFFARITLEDKLGSAYEPYIFAALNSSKVMVALGTKPEYFNAVWVKNEWSRYLALIKNGAKKILIPAYRDMDPYDLPEEFSHLQAQDMSKLGFMQDLVRGIQKLAGGGEKATVVTESNQSVAPLMKRIELFLSDGMYRDANEYCEKVLDMDPENGRVYVLQLLAQLQISKIEQLQNQREPFDHMVAYKNAMRFADDGTVEKLRQYNKSIRAKKEEQRAREEAQRQARVQAARQEEQRRAREQQNIQQQLDFDLERQATLLRKSQDDRLYQLKQEWKRKIGWCIFWFIVWWPIGVFLLFKLKNINNQIRNLERQL